MVAIGPTLSEVEERKGDEEQSRELEEIRVRERILHCSFDRSQQRLHGVSQLQLRWPSHVIASSSRIVSVALECGHVGE